MLTRLHIIVKHKFNSVSYVNKEKRLNTIIIVLVEIYSIDYKNINIYFRYYLIW